MSHGDCAEITSHHMQSKACSLPDKGQTFLLKSGMLTDSCGFFVLFPGGTQGNKHFSERMNFKRNRFNYCCKNLSEKTPSVLFLSEMTGYQMLDLICTVMKKLQELR